MTLSNIVLMATATLTLAAAFTAPALATDANKAIELCKARGPACTYTVSAAGGVDIDVDNHYVQCPPQGHGHCSVVYRTAGKTTVVKGGNVDAVLKAN